MTTPKSTRVVYDKVDGSNPYPPAVERKIIKNKEMSSNDQVVIRRKQNGLYDVRHVWAEEGTIEENTISVVADDVDGLENAVEKANSFLANSDYAVEYGLSILNN